MKRGRYKHIIPVFVILSVLFILGACSPVIKHPGPPVTTPHFTDSSIITNDGYALPLRIWQPLNTEPKAVLIAVHGFNDYSKFFQAPGAYLAKRSILTYAYDQRGFGQTKNHGFWAGKQTYLDDLKTVIKLIRAKHSDLPLFIIGESMGGAVTMTTMVQMQQPDVAGIILSAPAVWGRETMPFYQRWLLSLASHTTPWLTLTGKGLKIKPSDNMEMLRALGRDPLIIKETRIDTIYGLTNLMDMALAASLKFDQQSLILYGMRDDVIPKNPTIKMLKRLPETARSHQRIAIYDNGYHMLLRDLQAEAFWHDIATWIANPNAPLPSKADIGSRKRIASEILN